MLLQQVILFLLFILSFPALSQNKSGMNYLIGSTTCQGHKTFYLRSFRGTLSEIIDSAKVVSGKFSFTGIQPREGYYQLFSEAFNTDFIINPGISPQFKIYSCDDDSFEILNSPENALLQQLKKSRLKSGNNINEFREYADSLFRQNPVSYFTRSTKPYLTSRFDSLNETQFLSIIPFSDASLINSTIFPGLYMQYFRDYVNYDEEGFKFAIDTLMKLSSTNPEVREFTQEFLMDLFHRAGPEVIFEYMVNTYYLGPGCTNAEFEDHALKYMSLRPGSLAPDTILQSLSGDKINLSEFYKRYEVTLIYFWASDCPHCMKEHSSIKKLSEVFEGKLGIIGVSLDTETEDCKKTIQKESMDWQTVCDTKSWESPIARMFLINKTPSMILINNNGRIISRNTLSGELPTRLQDLLTN